VVWQILKFRVYWEDDDGVYRDVAIKHQQLLKIYTDNIEELRVDNKHQATFYRSNDFWQKGRQ